MQTEKNNFAYAWHYAICEPQKNNTRIDIMRIEPHSVDQRLVDVQHCDANKIANYVNQECGQRNIRSAREFLSKKPKIFDQLFIISLSGEFLTVEMISYPHFSEKNAFGKKNISKCRAAAILRSLKRWGMIWEFSPGLYCNLIKCV